MRELKIDPRVILDAEVMRVAARGVSFVLPRKVAEQQDCAVDMQLLVEGSMRRFAPSAASFNICAGMDGFRVAMQFTDMDEESAAALDALLAANNTLTSGLIFVTFQSHDISIARSSMLANPNALLHNYRHGL